MTTDGEEIERYHRVIDSSLRRNLLIERATLAGGILGLGAPISLLALHFSKPWAALAAIITAALLLLFFLRRYGLFRGILKEDAARYMDETFSLKERAASRIELGESAPRDDRVHVLDKQLSSLLPKAAEPPPLKIKKAAITSLILAPIPWIALLWITLSEASEIKNSSEVSLIEELLKENKTMPDELKETLKDLSNALSRDDISSLSVKDALKRSEEALKDALEGKGSESDSKTLEIESLPAETLSPTPTATPSPTPKVEITPTPQSSSDKDKSSKENSKESSKEESEGKKEESGSKGSSKQEKSGDGEEKDQKDGGQGKGGSSESKSEGKDSKEGEGKGESDSKEESKSLEGVGQALKEIKEKSESEKDGKEGKKGKADSKDGKDSDKPSNDDQGKANDQKEGASEKQDKPEEKSEGEKREGEKGEGEKKDSSLEDKTESDKKEGGKDKEKSGEKGEGDKASSLPLGAEIVPTPQGDEGESDGGPKTLDEVAVPGEDETLDARFTGEEKERVKNEKGGEAKVSLSDVKLSKPDEASAEEGQYIPPEYSEILR